MRTYPPIPEAADVAALRDLVHERGFGVLRGGGPVALAETSRFLGEVLFVEEVQPHPAAMRWLRRLAHSPRTRTTTGLVGSFGSACNTPNSAGTAS